MPFATHLPQPGYDIRTIQELKGYQILNTTMISTHVLHQGGHGVRSPQLADVFTLYARNIVTRSQVITRYKAYGPDQSTAMIAHVRGLVPPLNPHLCADNFPVSAFEDMTFPTAVSTP